MKKLIPAVILIFLTCNAFAQGNGKLQVHFINVGQGDAAVLISPKGEVIMFDNGTSERCAMTVLYLQQIGITKIDYLIASHYHDDHIGCTTETLGKYPLQKASYDRGSSYSTQSYSKYITAVGDKRKAVIIGEKIILDSAEATPVVVGFVTANGAGVSTTNENDLGVVSVIRFGQLDLVIGGDLSGFNDGSYEDIETPIANSIGQVEIYKVHHHGSTYGSNNYFLSVTKPKIGIISAGNGNSYGHPTITCLARIHNYGIKTYWTEAGGGIPPVTGLDIVGGNIVVEYDPDDEQFYVKYSNGASIDSYTVWGTSAPFVSTINAPGKEALQERARWDANGDNKIGIEEAIRALQIGSGLRIP